MSLGRVALGLASIALGLNTLNRGVRHLSEAVAAPRIPRNFMDGEAMPAPVRGVSVPGRPFANSGYRAVQTINGRRAMQMRSYNIRSLDDRIAYLRRLVDAGKRDPHVYAFTRRAVAKRCGNKWCIPEKDNFAEAQAIFGEIAAYRRGHPSADIAAARNLFRQIRRNVRYTSDIAGVDTYQKPAHTLALKTADCDDYSTLTCSALQSIGIPCRFKVIRTRGAPTWNHIYPEAGFPRQNPRHWVPMDSSVEMPFGWQAPPRMVAATRVFPVG